MDNKKYGQKSRRGIKGDIIRLRKEGYSMPKISEKLKCSKSTINYHLKREGLLDIGLKQIEVTDSDKKAIYQYTKKNKIKEAVNHFKKFSRTTIVKYMYRKNFYNTEKTKKEIAEFKLKTDSETTAITYGISVSSVNRYFKKYKDEI